MDLEQLICSICLAAQQNPLKLQKCVHSFCGECISQWLDIKNNCPLCLDMIGSSQHNRLLVRAPEQVQFDSGALNFQNQIKTIDETMINLERRINIKCQQAKNLKSHFPKSSLYYVEDQMLIARNYYSNLQDSILISDAVNASMYMQLVTEVLLDIQDVLAGGPIGRMAEDDYYSDQCCSDHEYSDEELEDYLQGQNARKQKARLKKTSAATNVQAKSAKALKIW